MKIPKCENSEVWKFRSLKIPKSENSEVQKFRSLKFWSLKNFQLKKFWHTDTCSFCSCKFGTSRKSNEIFYEKVFKWNSAFWCLLQKIFLYLMQKQSTLSYLMQKQLTPQSHEISMRRPPFWLFQLLHCYLDLPAAGWIYSISGYVTGKYQQDLITSAKHD